MRNGSYRPPSDPPPSPTSALEPLVERAAEDDVWGERPRIAPMQPADNCAGARPEGLGILRASQSDCPCDAPGQGNRPGYTVVVRLVVHRTQERKSSGAAGQTGQKLADAHAGDRRGNRLERPAILEGGVGLHVKRIEVARPTP